MNKILIIGISGTGKTRIARKISAVLKIPVTHYDTLSWGQNGKEVKRRIVEKKINEVLKKRKWIIEGYINPSAKKKLEKADIVIYLDYSGVRAFFGGIKRWWEYRGKTRPEMASIYKERLDLKDLKIMLTRDERQEIENEIKKYKHKIIRLKSWRETNKYITNLLK